MTDGTNSGTVKTRNFWQKLSHACRSALQDQLDIEKIDRDQFADEVGIPYDRLSLSFRTSDPQLPNKTHEYIRLLLRMEPEQVTAALAPILAEKGLVAIPAPKIDTSILSAMSNVVNMVRAEEGR